LAAPIRFNLGGMMTRMLIILTALLTAAACANRDSNTGQMTPKRYMDPPANDAHWTLQTAFRIDRCEEVYKATFAGTSVTSKPSKISLALSDDEPFAFQWLSYDGPTLICSFTLRADGTALVTNTYYYEEVENGETVLMPEYILAEFTPTVEECSLLRAAINDAGVGVAPAWIAREEIFDGLQWRMYLRVGEKTRGIRFSNAVPDRFRELMVKVFRDVCANHAEEIDAVPRTKGFVEFSGPDVFVDNSIYDD